MIDLWESGKWGMKRIAAFTGTATVWRIDLLGPLSGAKALFALYPTEDVYIMQSSQAICENSLATSSNSTLLVAGLYYPLVVENVSDRCIGLIRSSTSGNLNISLISDVYMELANNLFEDNWQLAQVV